jgi:hypothetical protein
MTSLIDWREVLRFFCWLPPEQLFPPESPDPDL